MYQLLHVAGSEIRQLRATETHIACLHHLSKLRSLELHLSPDADYTDLATLTNLRQLERLHVVAAATQPVEVNNLWQLRQLQSLDLVNMIPLRSLPPHITHLALRAADLADSTLPARARDPLETFGGTLNSIHLHLPVFGNDPLILQTLACLQQASRLQFFFNLENELELSCWCPGRFSQLQSLYICVLHTSAHFAPSWNFATCTGLQSFTVAVSPGQSSCLRSIHSVKVCRFHLQFSGPASWADRCTLLCNSWCISQADVTYEEGDAVTDHLPQYVSDALGALLLTRQAPPVLRVNGMSPTDAASWACRTCCILVKSPRTDSDTDSSDSDDLD